MSFFRDIADNSGERRTVHGTRFNWHTSVYRLPFTVYRRLFTLKISLTLFLLLTFFHLYSLPVFHSITSNSDTVGKYEKFELTVDLTANFINPFDWDDITLSGKFISPSGAQTIVDGFYYQDYTLNYPNPIIATGNPLWKIRFSPDQTGTWSYEVFCNDGSGTTYSATYLFVCINSSEPGFISQSQGNYQKFSNGNAYFPVGLDIPWNLYAGGFYEYEDWLDSLAVHDANFIKIIMAPWAASFGIEWSNTGLGNYTNRLDIAWWLDWILDKATEESIYMQLCPLIHNEVSTQFNNDWAASPYNAANGGPCNNTWDFYTNASAKYYYKRKLRYINARWGYSSHLASWELFTETDNTGDFNSHKNSINNWLIETGLYLKGLDINDHPVTVSYAFFENDPVMWNNNLIDFTQTHIYKTTNDLELKLHSGNIFYLEEYNKATITGEFALSHFPDQIIAMDPDGIAFHNNLWATSFSGSLGAPVSWHWDSYIDTMNLYHHFGPVSTFMNSVNLLNEDYEPVSVVTTSNNYLDAIIDPNFNESFTPAPDDEFTVARTGALTPREDFLGSTLYGYFYNSSRNPPHFYVDYAEDGHFSVRTGDIAVFSNIKIWVDYVNVLDMGASSNTTYTVDVSAGEHLIFVENTGNFYLEIDYYNFEDYAPECRSFALKDSTSIVGWLQNRNYNWDYINNYGYPPPLIGGELHFDNLHESYYEVEWWNCSTGVMDTSTILISNSNGELSVDAPSVVWDKAYKIEYIDSDLTPNFIASPTTLCAGNTVAFSNLSNGVVTSFHWQFPGGTPSVSTEENPVITYNTSGVFDVTLTITNHFDTTFLTQTAYIEVETIPQTPGSINGQQLVCAGETNIIYAVDPVAGADSYQWILPPGASGSSTSSSIFVSFETNALSGNIEVKASNDCGTSSYSSKYITVTPLVANAGPILGSPEVCQGESNVMYSVNPIANATQYVWSLPPGANGINTGNTINVTYSESASSGNITVYGNNQCGDGTPSSLSIQVDPLPNAAGPVYGDTIPCQGEDAVYYYVDPISEATSYSWTLPYGATGQSSTNEIYVAFDSALVCGQISVQGVNDCGTGVISSLNLCVQPQPVVTDHPDDTTVYLDGVAYFQVSNIFDLDYHWQVSTNNGTTWQFIEDMDVYYGSHYPIMYVIQAGLDMNGYLYRCMVSGNCEPAVFSDSARLTVIPPGWDFTETNRMHQLKIPVSATPTINDEPIELNDYIGVFYEQNGDMICGGLGQWKQELLTITAFGDDTTTSVKDGFDDEESFSWAIFSQNFNKDIEAEASIYLGPKVFTNGATSSLSALTAWSYIEHVVEVPAGWSGISSYVIPQYDSVATIFDSIENHLRILLNETGMFWPEQGINTIITWDPYQGYKINVHEDCQVTFRGQQSASGEVLLSAGWNIFPVLSDKMVSTVLTGILSDLGDTLIIVKEVAGTNIYWPGENIFSLFRLFPGKSYMANVTHDCYLHFPEMPSSILDQSDVSGNITLNPWNEIQKSPNSHVIAISRDALNDLKEKQLIGAFTSDNICAGVTTIYKDRGNLSLVIFGDDPATKPLDGFVAGELIKLKLYDPSSNNQFDLWAIYDPQMKQQGSFTIDGISKISDLQKQDPAHLNNSLTIEPRVFPNPFEHVFNIMVDNMEGTINYTIYDYNGRPVETYQSEENHIIINFSGHPNGVYLICIENKSERWYQKVVKK